MRAGTHTHTERQRDRWRQTIWIHETE